MQSKFKIFFSLNLRKKERKFYKQKKGYLTYSGQIYSTFPNSNKQFFYFYVVFTFLIYDYNLRPSCFCFVHKIQIKLKGIFNIN